MTTSTAPTRRQARRATSSPAGWPTDQLEFAIQEETPFSKLTRALLDPSAGMFELHLGMTLADYQNRWLDLVAMLTSFALAMTFVLGPKAPLNLSVWTAAAGAFLLAATYAKRPRTSLQNEQQ